MPKSELLATRVNCPCCGYPTLTERGVYDICELCNWEDDGQGNHDANVVRGGPNAEYSLTAARSNFQRYRVMYTPDSDQRITGKDSPLEYETKGQLVKAFQMLVVDDGRDTPRLEAEIKRLEQTLRDETTRQVREYESKHSTKGPAAPSAGN